MERLEALVKSCLPEAQAYVVGYADLLGLLAPEYAGLGHAVVFGRRLDDAILDGIQAGPTPAYLALYHQVNRELAELLNRVGTQLAKWGIRHVQLVPTRRDVDLDADYLKTLRPNFSHKMAATRAGLGWIGKTDLLVSRAFGPRLRLATLLMDYPGFQAGVPVTEGQCGDCGLCVQACPAQAATGLPWRVGVDRDDFFDAQRCREKCRELSLRNLGELISLCGRCVAVCPQGTRPPA
jgi:epoxyqueuosine reductase